MLWRPFLILLISSARSFLSLLCKIFCVWTFISALVEVACVGVAVLLNLVKHKKNKIIFNSENSKYTLLMR